MKSLKQQPDGDPSDHERRSWARYQAHRTDVIVRVSDSNVPGRLVDESIGGIGVTVETVTDFAFGQEVHVHMKESDAVGYVRSIRREDTAGFRVSIGWNDYLETGGKRQKPLAHFITHENLLFVCDLLFHDAGPVKLVRLWDGARFEIASDLVCSRSLDARRSELNRNTALIPALARMYGIAINAHTPDICAQILDFEFSYDQTLRQSVAQVGN